LQTFKQGTIIQALISKDKGVLIEASRGIDLQKAVSGLKLFQINNKAGFQTMLSCVSFLLTDLNNFFNVKGMNTNQILETADLICEKYTHSSLEDLIYCFKKIKKGEYGQLYNRLDGMIVLECLAKHEEEKADHIENEHRKFKNSEKSILNIPINLVDKSLEVFKEIEKEEQINRLKQIPKL
jgi:ribosomal protein L24E